MKKHLISFLSLLLVVIMIASTGCAKPENPDNENTTVAAATDPVSPETDPPVTGDPNFTSDVPEMNLGGRAVSMLVAGQSFAKDEFFSREVTGDLVNDAVYRRNTLVEQSLGVKLDITVESDSSVYNVGNKIRELVKAGDHVYDIVTLPGYTHTSYALEGDFENLLNVENLNLDKHYWTQGFNEIMSNGKQQYVASGAYSLSMIRNMYITLYNKTLLAERQLPDITNLALAGEWTVEKQLEIIEGMYTDTNGDGQHDSGDFYGFISGLNTSVDPYWVSFNFPILQLDDNNEYYIEIDREKMIGILESIIKLISKNDDTLCYTGDDDTRNSTKAINKFASKEAAMITTMVFQIENNLRNSGFDDEYGIAPIPKYNSDQTDYYTHTQDQLTLMAIVSTAPDATLGELGAVMDRIAYQSYVDVFPAYYENALSYRYLQNNESKLMLDKIYSSLKIEGCFIYSSAFAILGQLRSVTQLKLATASVVKANTSTWPAKVKALNEGLAGLPQ